MEALSVYIKTPDGRAEMSSRARRLTARERATLIMIDGRRCLAELQRLSPSPEEVTRHLQSFLDAGLIVPLASDLPGFPDSFKPLAEKESLSAAAIQLPTTNPLTTHAALDNARRYILEVAYETLGDEAPAFAARLMQSDNTRALLDLAHHLRDAVHRYSNAHEAQQFWETVREIAPKT